MSKIGFQPVAISEGVSVEIKAGACTIKGKEGEICFVVPRELEIVREENVIKIKPSNTNKKTKSVHGLYRQLIANAVRGVVTPWEKRLEVVGTGYNVKLQGEDLVFKLGYSHPVIFKKRMGVKFKVEGNNKAIISGADKQLVGEIAYQVKILKKPDVYKGKGIRYENERLRIKPGKKAKTAGAAA